MDDTSDVSDLDLEALEANSTTSEHNIKRLSNVAKYIVNKPDWFGDDKHNSTLPFWDDN
jgi:hypothetical protein